MRKERLVKGAAIVLGVILLILLVGFLGHLETTYTRHCEVITITEHTVVFRDSHSGHRWTWELQPDEKPYSIGEICILHMYTLGTDKISDDEILSVEH